MSTPSKGRKDEEFYEVEAIVGHWDSNMGRTYEIKWKGYKKKTSEPRKNLVPNSMLLVKAYEKKHPLKKKRRIQKEANSANENEREKKEGTAKLKLKQRVSKKYKGRSLSVTRSKEKDKVRSKSRSRRSKSRSNVRNSLSKRRPKAKNKMDKKQIVEISGKEHSRSIVKKSKDIIGENTSNDNNDKLPSGKKIEKLTKKDTRRTKSRSRNDSVPAKRKSELSLRSNKNGPSTVLKKGKKSTRTSAKQVSKRETEKEYDVDILLQHRDYEHGREYLVKWRGYRKSEATWEPLRHLSCRDLVRQYEHCRGKWKMPQKQKKRLAKLEPFIEVRNNHKRRKLEYQNKQTVRRPARLIRDKNGRWSKKNKHSAGEGTDFKNGVEAIEGNSEYQKQDGQRVREKHAKNKNKKVAGIISMSGTEAEAVDDDEEGVKEATHIFGKKMKKRDARVVKVKVEITKESKRRYESEGKGAKVKNESTKKLQRKGNGQSAGAVNINEVTSPRGSKKSKSDASRMD